MQPQNVTTKCHEATTSMLNLLLFNTRSKGVTKNFNVGEGWSKMYNAFLAMTNIKPQQPRISTSWFGGRKGIQHVKN